MKKMKCLMALMLVLTATCHGEEVNVAEVQKKANAGDAEAQTLLASWYITGKGVREDIEMALMWWRRAAEQGFAPAESMVGIYYAANHRDDAVAAVWLKKAAAQGDPAGQFALAKLELSHGRRVQALKWFALCRPRLTEEERQAAENETGQIMATLTPAEFEELQNLQTTREEVGPSANVRSGTTIGTLVVMGIGSNDTLSVRSGPGPKYDLIAKLPSGTGGIRTVDSRDIGSAYWIKIRVGDVEGWVNGKFVSPEIEP